MLFLVISSPSPGKPTVAREGQRQFWNWLNALLQAGTAKQAYTKLGRGAVVVFDVDSHETLHKLINQWSECVPAAFEVHAMLPKEHQEGIAMAGTDPMRL